MKTKFFTNLFLALCLVLGALAVAPVSPARAATLTVDTLMDENDGSCMDGDCSLRDAIQVAAPGDTITFSVNGTMTLTDVNSLNINKNLTISGPGPGLLEITTATAPRIFTLGSGASVTISGMKLFDVNTVNSGGAVYVGSASLTMDNVLITGNTATGLNIMSGGGIYVPSGGSLVMTNSQVTMNHAPLGSGIACNGCLSLSLGNVTLSGNDDVDTYDQYSKGGALYLLNAGTVNLNHVTMSGNVAGIGGGIFIQNSNTVITNSTISANTTDADTQGGAVYVFSNLGNTVSMSNVTISGNQQANPGLTVGGGGIFVDQGGLDLNNVTVAGNTSDGGLGGGGILVDTGSTVNFSNSIFADNVSATDDEDCKVFGATFISQDYNLIEDANGFCAISGTTTHNLTGTNPMLGALASNGGPTQTHALLPGSPAIDAGNDMTCAIADQRGVSRPFDGDHNGSALCDMGAYEVDNSAPSDIALSGDSVLENLPAGTMVGSFSTTDLDPADTHVYSFCGGADDASFTLNASDLQTASPFDFEAQASYSICVRTTDPFGLVYDEVFVISVLDVPGVELLVPADGVNVHALRPLFDWATYSGAIGYQLQVSKTAAFNSFAVNATLNGAANSQYTPTKDLAANTLYYWRVRHKISATKYGPWTATRTFTSGNPPSAPSLVAPAGNALVTNLTPTLDWSDSTIPAGTTLDHYQVQLDDAADFSSPVLDGNSNVSTMIVGPLSMNTKYYWRVRAWNTAGDYSAWSAARNFRESLPAPTLIAPISGITVLNLKPTFDWSDVTGATGYTLQVSLSNTFNSFAINVTINGATSQYTHSLNLQAGKTYYWRVRSNGTNGPSLWSTVESFVTP